MYSTKKLKESIDKLEAWVEAHNYKGYDPTEGLNSFLRPLALGNQFAERLLLQVIWKSPFNLRPFVGIKPSDSTKGRGYMAWGYLFRHKTTQNPKFKARAIACLDWLIANKAGHVGYSWGNHFDYVTRAGVIPAGFPIIVWSSLIGQAFLEAYEQTAEGRFLEVARGICTWIMKLPREQTSSGACLSYVPFAQFSMHNSNMLGAAMLARTWKHTKEEKLLEVACSAIQYSCHRQRDDGSWWYGQERKYHWIDNFHTGYNLDSLKRYLDSTGDETYRPHFQSGLRYFKDTFIEPSGVPRYYHDRTYPIDIQCAAQAIETLAFCSDEDPSCLDSSRKVAEWTIDKLQDPKGYFYYRQYPMIKAKIPYIHWGQSTMYKGLATLLSKLPATKVGDPP
jgi:rhamnogalacturonyl hydrolase YesR